MIGERIFAPGMWLHGAQSVNANTICTNSTKNVAFPLNSTPDTLVGARLLYNALPYGSYHPGGVIFAYVDGHVVSLSNDTAQRVLQEISSRQ